MLIPPPYKITPQLLHILSQIEAQSINLGEYKIPDRLKSNLQRISTLKSSLFSAKIEGNPLTLENYEISDDEVKKKEIFNLLDGARYIDKEINPRDPINSAMIRKLHGIALKDIDSQAGFFRKEFSAIFNMAGVAVYTPPPPKEISELLDRLWIYINKEEEFPLVTACIGHLVFEKIHPFLDGNGRIGRMLITCILKSKGFVFPFHIPLEEYLNDHRDDYYYFLDIGFKKPEAYLGFMLPAYLSSVEKLKGEIDAKINQKELLLLPPRQEEIYLLIRDHGKMSLDSLKRRFLKVPERTLRYDLKKLQDGQYIMKIGTTRGSVYAVLKK
jgi:Fic family protein